jgi:hypothetical protein
MISTAQGFLFPWPIASSSSHLASVTSVTSGRMQGENAGDPKLIGPMDGPAGNRNPFR